MMRLVDTHAHLDEIDDLKASVEAARDAGVCMMVAVGSDYVSNQKVLEIAAAYSSHVYPAVGLHPWELAGMDAPHLDRDLRFIEDHVSASVGIGEIGLDYHQRVLAGTGKDRQKDVFRALLELAKRHDKPALVHSRYAWKDAITLVKEVGVKRVVFHWYTGFSSTLRELLGEGYFISATPAAEYHEEHRRAIKEAPVENLLLETDCPVEYGREARYSSRPRDVLRVLGAVAQLKGLETNALAERTTANALALFGLKP